MSNIYWKLQCLVFGELVYLKQTSDKVVICLRINWFGFTEKVKSINDLQKHTVLENCSIKKGHNVATAMKIHVIIVTSWMLSLANHCFGSACICMYIYVKKINNRKLELIYLIPKCLNVWFCCLQSTTSPPQPSPSSVWPSWSWGLFVCWAHVPEKAKEEITYLNLLACSLHLRVSLVNQQSRIIPVASRAWKPATTSL